MYNWIVWTVLFKLFCLNIILDMDNTDFYEDFDLNKTDFEYAMNPGTYRRQTKDQQIYGKK